MSDRNVFAPGFFENIRRDISYALRGFRRTPVVAVTIVSTVALGLGLVTVAFTLLNALVFRVDQVPNVHEMFAVERPRTADDDRPQFTHADFDALRRETAVFADVYAQVSDVDGRAADARKIFGTFVTGNFFQVLRVRALMGRVLTPADEDRSMGRPVVVLSHRGWDRLFARDPAVGRNLLVNRIPFEIVGVMPEGFRGLAAAAPDDYWAPLSTLGDVRTQHGPEGSVGVDIVGRLKADLSPETALAGLALWDARRSNDHPGVDRTSKITLVPKRGTVDQPREAVLVTAPLFFACGLVLLIGCANVANLLLSRGVTRQREIGIRLSVGATRGRIVRQLLTESLLLALVAAIAGFAISRVALAVIVNALVTSMPPDIGDIRLLVPDADWRVWLFLLTGAVVSTVAFALAPALRTTAVEPVRTTRGEVTSDARPRTARDFLVGLQVAAAGLLLISAAVFLRSAFTTTVDDPGMRISDTVLVPIANEASRAAILQAVTVEPSVAAVAASWPGMMDAPPAAFAETTAMRTPVAYRFVSPEYFGVLDIAVVRGRAFTAAETASSLSVAIVSETTARALWPNADAVGQTVRLDSDVNPETRRMAGPRLESRTFTVVGVVRDVPGFRIAPLTKNVVYVPTSPIAAQTSLVARVHGDPESARLALLNQLITIDSNSEVGTMLWVIRMQTYFLQIGFCFTVVLGVLALALTLSGLFSVLSYLVAQRAKEIGVRMALGATTRDVTRLVMWQSIRPVGFGLVVGGGSAAAMGALLLATPAAAGIGEIVHVLDPVAYAGSILIIIAACLAAASIPATRAARLDPTQTLRRE